jgi:hypothetical protein
LVIPLVRAGCRQAKERMTWILSALAIIEMPI